MKHFVKFFVAFAVVAGCAAEESYIRGEDEGYFPLRKGLFHIYTVQETQYRPSADPQILKYQLMTEVVDSFPSQDQYTYVIYRSRRAGETEPWAPLDTWSARKDRHAVVVSEGNTSYVKLKFPVSLENRWDGNALNSIGEDEYAYADLRQPMQIDGMTFGNTLTVEEERNEDAIVFRDERRDIYALDVGLVYREIVQLNYCTDDTCLGQQIIEDGIEMKVALTEYGKH